ncbi:hypothetical protein SAMN04488066_1106 [Halorubrum aquaticum]|uniref:Uncharacterized protein n=1 Tax=Halorubrum aquaticum TaxID=387340 RepID=A0A1I3B6J1_9EURY|nr:hypothetical protein [Halorubrum aquaticum]SFH57830.1 hypothetical protein SAMN04488066_1106 [Halorubrum aquaticum]
MGIRCLLGHDFSEPEIEREREEDGEEVVTTVREVKTCARCGETQVVSENTEVTTMEQLTDQATTADASPSGAAGSTGEVATADDRGTPPTRSSDAGGADRSPDIDYGEATADGDAAASAGGDVANADVAVADPDGDDAEILDDGPGDDATGDRSADDDADVSDGGDGAVAADDEGAELIDEGPDDGVVDGSADGPADGTGTPSDSSARADAVDASEEPGADASAAGRDGASTADGVETGGDAANADADDGVILDEDDADSAADRDRGEWPEVEEEDDDTTFEASPWPEQQGDDEGFDAEIGDESGSGVEFGGLTPETAEPTAESANAEYVEPVDRTSTDSVAGEAAVDDAGEQRDDPGSGITREEEPEFETMESGTTPTEYYCPECGMTVESTGSSMRAGDICPECKRGYVAERPR